MHKPTYNTLLAIDSASSRLQLGLAYQGDRLVKKEIDVGQSHGQVIIRKIQDLLEASSCALTELDALVVNTGPGSFTGLRIGLAAAKAIAVSLSIPIVATHLFEIASLKLQQQNKQASIIIPFKKDEAFIYDSSINPFNELAVQVHKLTEILTTLELKPFAVYGWDIPEQYAEHPNNLTRLVQYDSSELLQFGKAKLKRNILADIHTLEPLYIQKSQAEINFELRNKQ